MKLRSLIFSLCLYLSLTSSSYAEQIFDPTGGKVNATFTGDTTFTDQALFADGTSTDPSIAFISEPALGWYRPSTGVIAIATPQNTGMVRAERVGVPSQYIALLGHNGNGSGIEIAGSSDKVALIDIKTGGRFQIQMTGIGVHTLFGNTGGVRIAGGSSATPTRALEIAPFTLSPSLTAGSGTGLTVNQPGSVERVTYKVTVDFTGFSAAALTADHIIATLPAKTKLVSIYSDTTTKFLGGAVTAATMIVGKTTGGNEYIVSHDVFTAAVTKGLADADLGTSINRANAIQGGDLPSWTATTNISVRLTTVTANTNALTQGSTTYYLVTEMMP